MPLRAVAGVMADVVNENQEEPDQELTLIGVKLVERRNSLINVVKRSVGNDPRLLVGMLQNAVKYQRVLESLRTIKGFDCDIY